MSKILEEVKSLRTSCYRDDRMAAISMPYFDKFLDNLEKELKEKEKQDKTLEIIKSKNVDVASIIYASDFDEETNEQQLKRYNDMNYDKPLTQQEFELLKEVLKND